MDMITNTARDRAWRRTQRQRAVSRAMPVVERLMGWRDTARVLRWADNLRKCSCPMCNSGNPHDSRQMRRGYIAFHQGLEDLA